MRVLLTRIMSAARGPHPSPRRWRCRHRLARVQGILHAIAVMAVISPRPCTSLILATFCWKYLGNHFIKADFFRYPVGDFLLVAREHDATNAHRFQAGNRFLRFRAYPCRPAQSRLGSSPSSTKMTVFPCSPNAAMRGSAALIFFSRR